MSENSETLIEELRLKIAWSKGYRPIPVPYGEIKLIRPGPPTGAFGLPNRSLEAPHWPKDLTAAFRLLKEFTGDEDRVNLTRQGKTWTCEIIADGKSHSAKDETPQIAICKAYVLAMEIELDE